MKNLFRILEIAWLVTAISCFVIMFYFLLINRDNGSAIYFGMVSVIATIIYFKRKHQRKQQQKGNIRKQ
jgi:hypothetical protein